MVKEWILLGSELYSEVNYTRKKLPLFCELFNYLVYLSCVILLPNLKVVDTFHDKKHFWIINNKYDIVSF